MGPYYADFSPVRLTTDTPHVRAWPGGVGGSKVGGNYAPTILPGAEAQARGYGQVLWLFGEDDEVTEAGAMNVFFVIAAEKGRGDEAAARRTLVTPPLDRGDILPGVTRRSVLELARERGDALDVVERSIAMPEVRVSARPTRRSLARSRAGRPPRRTTPRSISPRKDPATTSRRSWRRQGGWSRRSAPARR